MVILGGLEFVIGGYLIHRHHKKKHEKERLEDEEEERRLDALPDIDHSAKYPHHLQQRPVTSHGRPVTSHHQKHAYCHSQPQLGPESSFSRRPHLAQTFPMEGPYPHIASKTQSMPLVPSMQSPTHPQMPQMPQMLPQLQPLRRNDSFSTISSMPVANGMAPQHVQPAFPPQRQHLQPIPQNQALGSPYNNTGFSVSTPSFGPAPETPVYPNTRHLLGRNTVEDDVEPYVERRRPRDPEDGEDEPPPPYTP